jgi:F-type H+-transporting ATPase subunit b
MLIDWFTVGAQAVNFLVLVWLLKRFLYKPVLAAIDAREKRIAGELADADKRKTEAQAARDASLAATQALDLDAKVQGDRLLKEAHAAAEALITSQKAALDGERVRLGLELKRLAGTESMNIARALLKDMAGADLDVRFTEMFVKRVGELDPKSKESFGASLERSNFVCVVSSAFPIGEPERAMIQDALNVTFSADLHLQFKTSMQVIGGVELDAYGQRLSWTIADYLTHLDDKFGALLHTSGVSFRTAAAA